jgi:glycosyltransferase involved in cell wall biosynthesis
MIELRASVLIPTYNRCSFLVQTLTSLQSQSIDHERFEVIVAIDGSTDDTVQALERFKANYPLRWIYQPNQGSAAASNTAAREARHEVLIFLDDDQIASPDLVAVHLEVQQQQGPALVQGFYPLAAGYDRRGASLIYQHWLERSFAPLDRQHPITPEIWSANISLTRDLWAQVRGFDEGFRDYGNEDTDFGIRVAAIGVPVVFEPRALSYHLHRVSYGAARRQAFSGGKSIVHLARKHSLPIDGFIGGPIDHGATRRLASAWRTAPRAMDALGRTLIASLWAADLLRVRRLQLMMARVLHRYYKVGGLALETVAELQARVEHGAA